MIVNFLCKLDFKHDIDISLSWSTTVCRLIYDLLFAGFTKEQPQSPFTFIKLQ